MAPPVLLVAIYAVLSLSAPPSFGLTAFGDLAQLAIALYLAAAIFSNLRSGAGRHNFFWCLMGIGTLCWAWSQWFWVYYEVIARSPMPNPFWGDIVAFMHVVPMMGALGVQPHSRQNSRILRVGLLDLALLVFWWLYLYVFLVIPWHYIVVDVVRYDRSFSTLVLVQNSAFVVATAFLALRNKGGWRGTYAHLCGAGLVYAVSGWIANLADSAGHYYTGSIYDLPIIASVLWFTWAAVRAREVIPETQPQDEWSEEHGVWPARMAMVAILSMPIMAFWNIARVPLPEAVRDFRLLATLGATVLLTALLFVKQHLMDKELIRLLRAAHDSFDNLSRLQDQLLRSEKLASMGQLVAGAAHEINNPLTAILGYSDLLALEGSLPDEQRRMAEKIGQQARRTKTLVQHLLSFAKQAPMEKNLIDVNIVVANAVKLRELDLAISKVRIETAVADCPAWIVGDSSQLLQAFFHIINNAVDALADIGGGVLKVSTRQENGTVLIEFADSGPGLKDPQRVFDPFYTTKPVGKGTGLGLSACYGIVQEHQGHITGFNRREGGACFLLKFPAAAVPAGAPANA